MLNKNYKELLPAVHVTAILLASSLAVLGAANPLREFQKAQEKDLNEYRFRNLQRDEMLELLKYNESHFYGGIKLMIMDSNYSLLERCNAAEKSLALISNDPDPATLIKIINDLLENKNITEKNRIRLSEYLVSHGVALLYSDITSEDSIRLNKILLRWIGYLDRKVKKEHGYWRAVAFYQTGLRYAQIADDSDLAAHFIGKGKSILIEMLKLEQSGELEKKREQLLGVFMHFYEAEMAVWHHEVSREQLEKHLKVSLSELQTVPDLYARVVGDYFAHGNFDGQYQKALFLEEHLRLLSSTSVGRDLVYWLYSFYANRGDEVNMLRIKSIIPKIENK